MAVVTKELWKNVAGGVRWYTHFDPVGNQKTSVVQPGKTFTITPLERQINQQAVYDKSADPFTNGTFLNVKATDDTEIEEIESPDALSDDAISQAVAKALKGDTVPIEAMLERTTSLVTTERIYEELVLQDASSSLVTKAKVKVEALTPKPTGTDGRPVLVGERNTIVDVPPGPQTGKKDPNWKVAIE